MCRDVLKHESSGAFMFTFEKSYFGEVWELKLKLRFTSRIWKKTWKLGKHNSLLWISFMLCTHPASGFSELFTCPHIQKASATLFTSLNVEEPINEVDMILTIWSLQPHLHWKYLLMSCRDYRCYVLILWQLNAHREFLAAVTPVPVTSVSSPQTRTRRRESGRLPVGELILMLTTIIY